MPYARACPIWDVKPPLSLVRLSGSQLVFTGSSITGTIDRPKNFSDTHSGQIPTRTRSRAGWEVFAPICYLY